MSLKVTVASSFAVSPTQFWNLLCRSDTLIFITKGVAQPKEGERFPTKWEVGVPYYTPAFKGEYNFTFISINESTMQMETIESGGFIKTWRHFMSVKEVQHGTVLYIDEVELDAGWLSWPLSLWVRYYYKHRHQRWKKLLKNPNLARLT